MPLGGYGEVLGSGWEGERVIRRTPDRLWGGSEAGEAAVGKEHGHV